MFAKKAISPIIATVLLIVVAIALFLIVFFWVKSFYKETILKRGVAIETVCPEINFEVRKNETRLIIINRGNVPIQKFGLVGATPKELSGPGPLMPGDIWEKQISCTRGQTIKIIPFLRGQTTKGDKDYACEGQEKPIVC